MQIKKLQQQFTQLKLRDRPSQLKMIEAVHQALSQQQILCVEAPTGTGKTLSYLLASFHAKNKKHKIIISTATIALQEQLIKKDFPLFEKMTGEKIRLALAKGRQNYLCLAKLHQAHEHNDLLERNETSEYLLDQTKTSFWNGDKEELSNPIKDDEWRDYTTDSAGCSGKHCEYYEDCYFYKARNKMHSADFIVANHSLLLSDLELGSGVLLPEPENNVYIIDECHHLPERAIKHFAKSSALLGATEWINPINLIIQRAVNHKFIDTSWQQKTNQSTLALTDAIKKLKSQLDLNKSKFEFEVWRVTDSDKNSLEITQFLLTHAQALNTICNQVNETLEQKLELKTADKKSQEELIKQHSQLKFLLSRIGNFFATWKLFCQQQQTDQPPVACWFELSNEDYVCHCSPINVSAELKTMLWDRVDNGALLCSATIRSLGSFTTFLRKTGLKFIKHTKTNVMPAIFNYTDSLIFVPSMQHEPSGTQQQAHRQEALDLLPELILPHSGTLVLFTSRSAMHEAFDQLPPSISLNLLMQGKQSKMKLVEQHKKRIDSGERSILFGLASFAEGIDLPAQYCQHVIIHKLPFAVPNTPIELTRSEWINKHKLNPFILSTLPETSIKLTQYVGRLIRQEDDFGLVTILDKRLYSKNYGRQLLANLPPFTQLINAPIAQLKKQPSITHLFKVTTETET